MWCQVSPAELADIGQRLVVALDPPMQSSLDTIMDDLFNRLVQRDSTVEGFNIEEKDLLHER